MRRRSERNTHPVVTAGIATAWSTPLLVTAAMVCPPALLAIPAAGAVAAGRKASKRRAARHQAELEATEMDANWARWNQLDPTSPRGY